MSSWRLFRHCIVAAVAILPAACGGAGPPGNAVAPVPPISAGGAAPPSSLAATPSNIYVAGFNGNDVEIFNGDANGDVEPVRDISGGGVGQGDFPFGLALDNADNLYVSYFHCDCYEVFPPGANGRAKPTRKVSNPLLIQPNALVNDAVGDTFVAALTNGAGNGHPSTVSVFPPGADGSVSAIGTITIPAGGDILGLAFGPNGRLYVAVENTIYIYAAGTCGPASPIAKIEGSNTELVGPKEMAFDSSGVLYVANGGMAVPGGTISGLITEYAPGATGNVSPIRTIAGPATGISNPWGVAVDNAGRVYAADLLGNSVTVYAPGSNGNVAPIRRIAGNNTLLHYPAYIIVR